MPQLLFLEMLGGSTSSGLFFPISPSSFMGSGKKFLRYRIIEKPQIGVRSSLGLSGEGL